jgi:hypothetical protein
VSEQLCTTHQPYDSGKETVILACRSRFRPDVEQEAFITVTPEQAEGLCTLPRYRVATQEEYDAYLAWNKSLYPDLSTIISS